MATIAIAPHSSSTRYIMIAIQLLLSPLYLIAVGVKMFGFARLLYRWKFPLSEVPGPAMASWTRFWWLRLVSRSNMGIDMARLHGEYGPIVRIAPNTVLVGDPNTTRRILAVGSEFKRGPWFDSLRLDATNANVVSERDSTRHQRLRSILGPSLSGNDVQDVEAIVDEHIQALIHDIQGRMDTSADRKITVDLSNTIPLLTLDIISHLCLGTSFECVKEGTDVYEFFKALNYGMTLQQYISVITEATSIWIWLGKYSWARRWLFPRPGSSNGISRVMMKIQDTVASRCLDNEKGRRKNDILDSILARGLSVDQAMTEILVIISSGVGATSYAIQSIIKCTVADDSVTRKMQDEIDATLRAKGRLQGHVPNSVIKNMTFLQACILEGLRTHAPVFSQLRERVVPPEGAVLNGYSIPGGTFVGLNTIGTQLNSIFGDNVSEFCPERWCIEDETHFKLMRRDLDLVFGHGNSKCLGINIANLEINKVIFEIFRTFQLDFSNKAKPWKSRGDFVLEDFKITMTHRDSMGQLSNGTSI